MDWQYLAGGALGIRERLKQRSVILFALALVAVLGTGWLRNRRKAVAA